MAPRSYFIFIGIPSGQALGRHLPLAEIVCVLRWCHICDRQRWKHSLASLSLILTVYSVYALTLPLPLFLSCLSPHGLLTRWQPFVNRYQFAESAAGGTCCNHLYLRALLAAHLSHSRYAGAHLPLSGCQAERVCGMWERVAQGNTHFSPKVATEKTLNGI